MCLFPHIIFAYKLIVLPLCFILEDKWANHDMQMHILFSYRRTLRCCRWWPTWTNTLPGTRASSHSRRCCWWRWCRCCWCSRRKNSGLCSFHRSPRPRQKQSRGLSAPVHKQKKLNDGKHRSQALNGEKIKINRAPSSIYRRAVVLF